MHPEQMVNPILRAKGRFLRLVGAVVFNVLKRIVVRWQKGDIVVVAMFFILVLSCRLLSENCTTTLIQTQLAWIEGSFFGLVSSFQTSF